MFRPHVALTIAGSDPSAGAGIQSDLRTFVALGIYPTTVVTAVTAQDTVGVVETLTLRSSMVSDQIRIIVGDVPPDSIKIGMLGDPEVAEAVAEALKAIPVDRIVFDPVLASTGGRPLFDREALETLRRRILPISLIVTPNLEEAEALTGAPVGSAREMEEAARRIHGMGARNVLVTGGHLKGSTVTDVWFDGQATVRMRRARIPQSPHGTGCVLSASIAAYLAKGSDPDEAVRRGIEFTSRAIANALRVGKGTVCDPGRAL